MIHSRIDFASGSHQVKHLQMAANMLRAFHCQHTPPYSLWCSNNDTNQPKCWEAEGLSSRMIEMKMKGIPTLVASASSNVPHDNDDFGRCYRLLQKYPEWNGRLDEMTKYGETWKRLVARWTQLTQLYESKQFEKLDFLLKHLKKTAGLLQTYQVPEADDFKLVGDVSLACLVPRDNQDEYDIYPVAILEPPNYLKIYDNSGKVSGWEWCRPVGQETKDEPIRTKEQETSYSQIDSAIMNSPKTWTSCIFHHCPHFASPSSDLSQMFATEVYSINGKKMGCCLISVPVTHLLHPQTTSKPENRDGLIVYNNCLWQVSSSPIAENTYYEMGLINV